MKLSSGRWRAVLQANVNNLCKGTNNTLFYCKDFAPCCEYRILKLKQTLALKTRSDEGKMC